MEIKPQPGPQEAFLSTPADIAIYGGAAGGGKAIKLDTVLPTPDGWVKMGDIKQNDFLFDEHGEICQVLKVYDIIEDPELYRITFDDGAFIDACKDHLWNTYTVKDLEALTRRNEEFRAKRRGKRQSRAKGNKSDLFVKSITERNKTVTRTPTKPAPTGSVKTTLQIYNTLTYGKSKRRNHAIKVCEPLNLPDIKLPIDPYVLGLWLGDGTGVTGTITTTDLELTDKWVKVESSKYTYRVPGLTHDLRQLGVIGNKHVPAIYLRAGRGQRLALLQGLMDTDGTVKNNTGSVTFDNTNEHLVDAVIELACSLGHKPGRKTKTTPKLNGVICKECFSVNWTPPEYVFRISRKRDIQLLTRRRTTQFRYISNVEPIESTPARCISVTSKNGLFLVGTRMIPTHNSWGLLMEPLRHMDVPGFTSVIFRRTYPEFENEGGLWDDSEKLYPYAGGIPKESALSWQFPSPGCNNVIKFSHMEHEKSKLNYQGSQICFLGFDELTHFTESQFTYMLSRNRSTCGVKPYIRATCNPDADSWVSRWVAWYIGEDGYPIPERSGVIRYFVRVGDNLYWGNTQGDLWEQVQGLLPTEDFQPKSFTFIPAKLDDNPALIAKDPSYRANLLALNMVDRLRLLGGNWKIRPAAGTMFRVEWFRFIDPQELPSLATLHLVRAWDTAATEPTSGNPNPDWTAGVLMGEHKGQYYIIDLVHIRKSPAGVEAAMGAAAELDGRAVDILMEQEPGSASKREADRFKRGLFAGYSFRAETTSGKGNKIIRAKPLSSAVENGLVYLVRGAWNYTLIGELVNFPDPAYHDDIVDATAGAFEYLSRRAGRKGAIDLSGMLQQKGSFLGI